MEQQSVGRQSGAGSLQGPQQEHFDGLCRNGHPLSAEFAICDVCGTSAAPVPPETSTAQSVLGSSAGVASTLPGHAGQPLQVQPSVGSWSCPSGHAVPVAQEFCGVCGAPQSAQVSRSAEVPGGVGKGRTVSAVAYVVLVSVLGLVALVLAFGGGAQQRAHDVSSTLRAAELNNSSAQGAPQQTVVNGWAARDLLALQVDRSDALIAQQQRTNGLLAILIITVAVVPLVLRPRRATIAGGQVAVTGSTPAPPLPSTRVVSGTTFVERW